MSNAITTAAITAAATITAEKLLTKKQVAILDNLNGLDSQGLSLVALMGKGQAASLAAEVVSEQEFDKALKSFTASNCTNVRPFAVLINSLTGQFTNGKSLNPCPTRKVDFFAYAATLTAWLDTTENEKTAARRAMIVAQCHEVITHVQALSDAAHAERMALQEAKATA